MKKLLLFTPIVFLSFSWSILPVFQKPWNEERTDSLGNVNTVHSNGEAHSTFHYDLTKVLALKAGIQPDMAELIARYCALVDQLNPKSGYPYAYALTSISIPDTFPSWSESLAGTERGNVFNSNIQRERTAQYWHFPFRDPSDTLTGQMMYISYPAVTDFNLFTGPPDHFWRVPITYNLKHIMNWALYNGGQAGKPDALTITDVQYYDTISDSYKLVQPNSIQAFAIFLHSLGDSYSHEECMVYDTLRSHPSSSDDCGLTYHTKHEYAYDTNMRAKSHADSSIHAIWRCLIEFKKVHNINSPPLWKVDNNGFQDGDGIPDELEDDGDNDYTESFLELWKSPAPADLNGDGIINHSDHTTWRIQVCNNEILTQLPSQYFEPLVNVFPNPVTNHIQFILLQKAEIVILNIQGQKIITLNTQEGKTNIDVSCLESGIYFIKITMDKEIVTRKFIKAQ